MGLIHRFLPRTRKSKWVTMFFCFQYSGRVEKFFRKLHAFALKGFAFTGCNIVIVTNNDYKIISYRIT